MHDDALSARLADDLDAAFEALVRAHQDRLYSIALRILGDTRDAEEIAQDAFVRAYRALATYDRAARRAVALRPWLATIVVNLARNRARLRGRRIVSVPIGDGPHAVSADAFVAGDDGPEAATEKRERRTALARHVAALPERYRVAIVLRHVDDLSYPEMAAALRTPEGTLKAQVHRGLALLRASHDAAERATDPAPHQAERVLEEVIR